MMKNVLLSLKSLVLVAILSVMSCQLSLAQSAQSVTGIVTDDSGAPLIGAAVMIEGSTVGASTGIDGSFTINASTTDILHFSYIGCVDQTITVGVRTKFDVMMKSDSEQLEEVVVVGFGTQKKVNLSGSVASAGSEVLEDRPITNVGQGLQGVIPNLNVSMNSTGDPMASPTFNIRGTTSINGGDPLVLVDGIEMDVNDLNPNDIKSISVLKDAGAAAIYGARAAFGVILIETKTAEEGSRPRVQFSAEFALNQPIFNIDLVEDPYQYANLRNAAVMASTGAVYYDEDYIAGIKAYQDDPINNPSYALTGGGDAYRNYAFNNYTDLLIAPVSPQQKYDVSLSGSGKSNRYYASLGFFDQDGMYNSETGNENFQRFNAILKNDVDLNDWLSADSKVVFNGKRSDKVHDYSAISASLASVYRMSPISAMYMPEGVTGFEELAGQPFELYNYIALVDEGGRDIVKSNTFVLSQGLTATPMEGLKIRGEFSYRNNSIREDNTVVQVPMLDAGNLYETTYGNTASDYTEVVSTFDEYYTFNAYAEYAKKIGKHDFKGMVGYNYEWGHYSAATATAYTLASSTVTDLNATIGTQYASGGQTEVALMGVFYRGNYSYDDRYLVEFNGRYDGTSRFPSDSRFGFFPSFSTAWRLSEEQFMDSTRDWLDNLKVRASYGELGNQSLDDNYYPYISTMPVTSNYVLFDGGSAYSTEVGAPGLVAPTLTWESVNTLNFGVDIAMFNNKFNLSFDKYTRDTKDMLMSVVYPEILSDFDSPQENGADLRTKGWELSLTYRGAVGRDFTYAITAGLSDYTTEITKYNNPSGAIDDYYVGKQYGEIWGFETVGIFATDEEAAAAPDQTAVSGGYSPQAGDIQYADLNGDGVVDYGGSTLDDMGDRKVIGNTTPRYSYSLNLNMNYKAFGLDMFWQGVGKCDYMPTWVQYDMFYPYSGEGIQKSWVDDCWSEDNLDAYYPRPIYGDGRNFAPQTRYLQDASYLRLKSLVFSYKLPQKFLDKVGIGAARVSVSGSNLLTFSKIGQPLDPEYNVTRVTYPLMKTYSMSLSLTL